MPRRGQSARVVVRQHCNEATLARIGSEESGAVAVTRLLGTMLFRVQPYDPLEALRGAG